MGDDVPLGGLLPTGQALESATRYHLAVKTSGPSLGLCGNSGRSSEPHLYYHLQTTPIFFEGEGLPAQFLSYVADGKEVERGEPVKGQTVRVK